MNSTTPGSKVPGNSKTHKARGYTEKLLTRTTSGLVYAGSIVLCLFLGPIPTAILMATMAWLACSEFFRMMRKAGRTPSEFFGLLAAFVFPFLPLLDYKVSFFISFVLLFLVLFWYIGTPRANISDVAITLFGPLYTGLLLASIVHIRQSVDGLDGALLTFGVMGSVWVNDSLAYLVGSRFGKNKLAPKISPNKSWEGFIGGMFGSFFIWMVIYLLHVVDMSFITALIASILVGGFAVLGDLFESRIKRGVGIKDSGTIIPGHGGLLDRSDSLIFGVAIANLIFIVVGIV